MGSFRSDRAAGPAILGAGAGLVSTGLVAWLCLRDWDEMAGIATSCPPWALALAIGSHLATVVVRGEAWGVALTAAVRAPVQRLSVHAANCGGFLAANVQSHLAVPVRMLIVRRLAPHPPRVVEILLADAPVFLLEAALCGGLALVAVLLVPGLPWWLAPTMLAASLGALVALRSAHRRSPHTALARGLAALDDRRLLGRLLTLVGLLTGFALLRAWAVLTGFGLPSGPGEVALTFVTLGAVGLLPLGAGTGPVALVAVLGTGDLGTAAAAGVAVSATTLAAVLLYAAACAAAVLIESRPLPEVVQLRTEITDP
jgi:hypothetical protein